MSRNSIIVTPKRLSPNNLLTQLVQFLIRVPPPSPLEWESFRLHVVNRYGGYFPETVINEMYASIKKAYTERKEAVQVITIDSDTDCGEPEVEVIENAESPEKKHVLPSRRSEEPQDVPFLTDSEWSEFREERVVKKYEYYLKEIYSLVKEIQDTTSCSVCAKLKARITKFTNYVSKDSAIVQMKVAQNSKSNSTVEPQRNSAPSECDSKENVSDGSSTKRKKKRKSDLKLNTSDLSDGEVEQVRLNLLVDKLIEMAIPDIMEATKAVNENGALTEYRRTKKPKRKSKKEDKLEPTALSKSESAVPKKKKRGSDSSSKLPQYQGSPGPETNVENKITFPEETQQLITPKHAKRKKKAVVCLSPLTSRELEAVSQ